MSSRLCEDIYHRPKGSEWISSNIHQDARESHQRGFQCNVTLNIRITQVSKVVVVAIIPIAIVGISIAIRVCLVFFEIRNVAREKDGHERHYQRSGEKDHQVEADMSARVDAAVATTGADSNVLGNLPDNSNTALNARLVVRLP